MNNDEVIRGFLQWIRAAHSPDTVKSYDYGLRHLGRWLEERGGLIVDCTLGDLMQYLQFLEGLGLKSGTRNHYVGCLRSVWRWLRSQGLVQMDEGMIPLPTKVDTVSIPVLPPDVLERMLGSFDEYFLKDLRNKTIVRFLFLTGIRSCELRSLHISNVDLEGRKAYVKTYKRKNHFRWVYFDLETKRLLIKWMEAREKALDRVGASSTWLFNSLNSRCFGDPLSKSGITILFVQLRKKLKIRERISAHSARHGHATYAAKNGMNIWKLKDDMGHATLKSTQVYVHIDRKDVQDEHTKIFKELAS